MQRGALRGARHPDDRFRLTLLFAGQCRERGRRRAAVADLAARRHTKNILTDARVSVMLDERKEGDPLQGAPRDADGLGGEDRRARTCAAAISRISPKAEMFAGFKDFAFYEVKLNGAHLVAGFGRIVDLKPADVLTDLSGAEALLEAEPGVIEHMNADHAGRRGSTRRNCSARRTATGAWSAAIRKALICNSSAPDCACRSRSALSQPGCAACGAEADGGAGQRRCGVFFWFFFFFFNAYRLCWFQDWLRNGNAFPPPFICYCMRRGG